MKSQCQNCFKTFEITDNDQEFYNKMKVPAPTFCPDCRNQRRLVWRNELSLYPDECDLCKKKIISQYSPDKPYKVYCGDCWYSDKWNPLDYAQDYDFNKPFFE
ncbi:MAG: zinc-ribbon domain containing protein, partial [Patescibacteria group bacterium]